MRNTGSTWIGIILIVVGFVFLLDTVGVVYIGDVIHNFWPLLLVLIGLSMLLRRESTPTLSPPSGTPSGTSAGPAPSLADRLERSNQLGDIHAAVVSQHFMGGKVSNVFGDIVLDATRAVVADGEHDLVVSGVFGSIKVFLPAGVAYSVYATLVAGDIKAGGQRNDGLGPTLQYETPGYATAAAKLRLRLSLVFGDITTTA